MSRSSSGCWWSQCSRLTGVFASSTRTFHAKFHNAAGLEPGATVRFEGGPRIGRVEKLKIDPTDPSLVDMEFSVKNDVPVKTDSRVARAFRHLSPRWTRISSAASRKFKRVLMSIFGRTLCNDSASEVCRSWPPLVQKLHFRKLCEGEACPLL